MDTARKVKELFKVWQSRGLYIFYLPPYSPQLNIIERLWKEFKEGWLKPSDYLSLIKDNFVQLLINLF